MRIGKRTKWKDIELFLEDGKTLERVLEKVVPTKTRKSIFEATVGEYIMLCENDVKTTLKYVGKSMNALDMLGRIKTYRGEMRAVEKYISANKMKEQSSSITNGVTFPTWQESILLTCQQRFFLHSMKEAEDVKLVDWMVTIRSMTAEKKMEHNNNEMLKERMKCK